MTEMIERVARAIDDAEVGYHIKLVRLVDDVSTYTLQYGDSDEVLEFESHYDASCHVRTRLQKERVRAAIAAMREPTERMRNEGESAATIGIGKPVDDEALPRVWRAMIDTILSDAGPGRTTG